MSTQEEIRVEAQELGRPAFEERYRTSVVVAAPEVWVKEPADGMRDTRKVVSAPVKETWDGSCLLADGAPVYSGITWLYACLEGKNVSIGRAQDMDLCIRVPTVSRTHASLHKRGEVWSIRSTGGRNGLSVDGHQLEMNQERQLGESSYICLGGDVTLRLLTADQLWNRAVLGLKVE